MKRLIKVLFGVVVLPWYVGRTICEMLYDVADEVLE